MDNLSHSSIIGIDVSRDWLDLRTRLVLALLHRKYDPCHATCLTSGPVAV